MVAIRIRLDGKKREQEEAGRWSMEALYTPLLVAALAVLGLIVTLHVMCWQWLLDSRFRQYMLYLACVATAAAFVACSCIALLITKKQVRQHGSITEPLMDEKKAPKVCVNVEFKTETTQITQPAG